jgi:hypothetical protein
MFDLNKKNGQNISIEVSVIVSEPELDNISDKEFN